jgi:hypothetical protein
VSSEIVQITAVAPEDEAEIARYMRLLGGMAEEPGELRAG